MLCQARAQLTEVFSHDFDDGNVADYILVDHPVALISGTPFADFSFPDGGIRVNVPVTPDVLLGPSAAGFEFVDQPNEFATFRAEVDVVAWDDTVNSSFGLTARTSDLGPGTTDFYGFGIFVNDPDVAEGDPNDGIAIFRVDGGVVTDLGFARLDLNPNTDYQLQFAGIGPQLSGEIFHQQDPSTALATVEVNDDTFSVGGGGIFAAASNADPTTWLLPTARVDVTFDNYSLSVPEPTGVAMTLFSLAWLLGYSRQRGQ